MGMRKVLGQRCLSLILIGTSVLAGVASWRQAAFAQQSFFTNASDNDKAANLSRPFRHVAEKVLPALVTIELSGTHDDEGSSRRWNNCIGSGFIIDRSGVILTNHHVVDGVDGIIVRLADGREFRASDIRWDSRSDLAIIRIEGAGDLPTTRLGNSDEIQVGDWTVAVGNPFGLGPSVTVGILSGKERKLEDCEILLLQTDAATNPGSSGGPLLNLRGDVVGVNEGGFSTNGGFEGVGFAIPVNVAKFVVNELLEKGRVRRSWLGVASERLSPDVAAKIGLNGSQRGVILTGVLPETPAARSGFQVGDVITHFADKPIRTPEQLGQLIEQTPAGVLTEVKTVRNTQVVVRSVGLEIFSEGSSTKGLSLDSASDQAVYMDKELGLVVVTMSSEVLQRRGYGDQGEALFVKDVLPHRVAYYRKIEPGMVIRRVGKKQVRNVRELKSAMGEQSLKQGVLVLIGTPQGNHFVVFKR